MVSLNIYFTLETQQYNEGAKQLSNGETQKSQVNLKPSFSVAELLFSSVEQ
jgi:hypothetical protein